MPRNLSVIAVVDVPSRPLLRSAGLGGAVAAAAAVAVAVDAAVGADDDGIRSRN